MAEYKLANGGVITDEEIDRICAEFETPRVRRRVPEGARRTYPSRTGSRARRAACLG